MKQAEVISSLIVLISNMVN